MNLPNKLTLTRILLVPVFMVFVSLTSLADRGWLLPATYYLIAGIVFAAASFTDFLDGHLARKWNMVTDFGKFADPLADKLLTTVAFIYMMRDGVCSPVVLCIILAREFAVSGLRMVAAGAKDGKVIAANMWGKVKTVLQMLSIIFYFFGMVIRMCTGNELGPQMWRHRLRAVLAGGCCDRHFRHQVPVGQPQLHQYRKINARPGVKKGRETALFEISRKYYKTERRSMKKFADTARSWLSIALNFFIVCLETIAVPMSWDRGKTDVYFVHRGFQHLQRRGLLPWWRWASWCASLPAGSCRLWLTPSSTLPPAA